MQEKVNLRYKVQFFLLGSYKFFCQLIKDQSCLLLSHLHFSNTYMSVWMIFCVSLLLLEHRFFQKWVQCVPCLCQSICFLELRIFQLFYNLKILSFFQLLVIIAQCISRKDPPSFELDLKLFDCCKNSFLSSLDRNDFPNLFVVIDIGNRLSFDRRNTH